VTGTSTLDEDTMTFIGKLSLFANLIFSLLIAGVAAMLFLNRIDWSDKPLKDGSQGQLVELQKKIKQALDMRGSVEARWREARAPEPPAAGSPPSTTPSSALLPLEKRRYGDRAWYQEQLAKLFKDVDADNPAQEVERYPANHPDPKKQLQPIEDDKNLNKPKMKEAQFKGAPMLKSQLGFRAELAEKRTKQVKLLQDLAAEKKLDAVQTSVLIGEDSLDDLEAKVKDPEKKKIVEQFLADVKKELDKRRTDLDTKEKRGLDTALAAARVKLQGLEEELRSVDRVAYKREKDKEKDPDEKSDSLRFADLATDAVVNVQLAEERLKATEEEIEILENFLRKRKVDVKAWKR